MSRSRKTAAADAQKRPEPPTEAEVQAEAGNPAGLETSREEESSTVLLPMSPRILSVIEQFTADAEANPHQVKYRGDTLRLVWNVKTGYDNAKPLIEELARVASVPVEHFRTLPVLARAVHYSDMLVDLFTSPTTDEDPFQQLRRLRRIALLTAEIAIERGFFSAKKVANVRSDGRTNAAVVEDGLQFEKLFSDNLELLVGPLVLSSAEMDEMGELSNMLMSEVPPADAKPRQVAANAAILRRNRMYSLLVRRYTRFREAAVPLLGLVKALQDVPNLHSRTAPRKALEEMSLPEIESPGQPDSAAS